MIVIGQFSSENKAKAAVSRLIAAHINETRINSYPSLKTRQVREPDASEKVHGADTPMSRDGPLGHFEAIIAKLFHADSGITGGQGGSEPTRELTEKTPVYLFVDPDDAEDDTERIESMFEEAGASRIAHHHDSAQLTGKWEQKMPESDSTKPDADKHVDGSHIAPKVPNQTSSNDDEVGSPNDPVSDPKKPASDAGAMPSVDPLS